MSVKEDYEKKMQAQLDAWKVEIDMLKGKVDQAETNLQLDYYTWIEELRLELDAAHQKLQMLKKANDEKWEEIKADVELTWDSLRGVIRSITSP